MILKYHGPDDLDNEAIQEMADALHHFNALPWRGYAAETLRMIGFQANTKIEPQWISTEFKVGHRYMFDDGEIIPDQPRYPVCDFADVFAAEFWEVYESDPVTTIDCRNHQAVPLSHVNQAWGILIRHKEPTPEPISEYIGQHGHARRGLDWLIAHGYAQIDFGYVLLTGVGQRIDWATLAKAHHQCSGVAVGTVTRP